MGDLDDFSYAAQRIESYSSPNRPDQGYGQQQQQYQQQYQQQQQYQGYEQQQYEQQDGSYEQQYLQDGQYSARGSRYRHQSNTRHIRLATPTPCPTEHTRDTQLHLKT